MNNILKNSLYVITLVMISLKTAGLQAAHDATIEAGDIVKSANDAREGVIQQFLDTHKVSQKTRKELSSKSAEEIAQAVHAQQAHWQAIPWGIGAAVLSTPIAHIVGGALGDATVQGVTLGLADKSDCFTTDPMGSLFASMTWSLGLLGASGGFAFPVAALFAAPALAYLAPYAAAFYVGYMYKQAKIPTMVPTYTQELSEGYTNLFSKSLKDLQAKSTPDSFKTALHNIKLRQPGASLLKSQCGVMNPLAHNLLAQYREQNPLK